MINNFVLNKGYDGVWSAVKRENYFDLFNDYSKVKYRSRSVEALEEMIEKTNGDESKIDDYINKKELVD